MQCRTITKKDKQIPARLASLLNRGFPEITAAGNLDILADSQQLTGLFCSRNCPGGLILPSFDHVTSLRDGDKIVVSGYHSEMEQECLKILLRGTQLIIICPARAIQSMRVPGQWKIPLAENRLLILSPFDQSQKRATVKLAEQRNRFVAALSDQLFVIHTQRGTETFSIAVDAIRVGQKTLTLKDEENQSLIEAGTTVL